jgi:hypothetical protein
MLDGPEIMVVETDVVEVEVVVLGVIGDTWPPPTTG